jgi:hypothetical protein
MENDSNKIEGIFKEHLTKVSSLLEKVNQDFKNNIIDPLTLEEMRKIMKVRNVIKNLVLTKSPSVM